MRAVNSRERVIGLLEGKTADRVACFSGMGTVCVQALKEYGYKFSAVHQSADQLAKVAAFPHQAYSYECAVVPFDICVEAEILGCQTNFYPTSEQFIYPKICRQVIGSENDFYLTIPDHVKYKARVPIVVEAIQRLKETVGREVPVGSHVLGPYTLAGQIMDINLLLRLTLRKQEKVMDLLCRLTELIKKVIDCYQEAGADYICIREMSATTDILPPQLFTKMIKPNLENIFSNIRAPKILHICGGSIPIISAMLSCGANAISVENKGRLHEVRALAGPEPLIFGNIDGYGIMVEGSPEDVQREVIRCLQEGSDGIWPSCEFSLDARAENVQAMVKTVEDKGAKLWFRRLKTGSPE